MYTTITAAEAAALIKNGDSLGLSGFTPAGTAKAVTAELAKIEKSLEERDKKKFVLDAIQTCRNNYKESLFEMAFAPAAQFEQVALF